MLCAISVYQGSNPYNVNCVLLIWFVGGCFADLYTWCQPLTLESFLGLERSVKIYITGLLFHDHCQDEAKLLAAGAHRHSQAS